MTTLKLAGATRAEDSAMRGLLEQHGVKVGRYDDEIDTAKLKDAGIDVDKLEKSGGGALTLETLRKATFVDGVKPRADVARKQSVESAQLAVDNVQQLMTSATASLAASTESMASGALPDRQTLTKLASMMRSTKYAIDNLAHDGASLLHIQPEQSQSILQKAGALVAAHSPWAKAAGFAVQSQSDLRMATTVERTAADMNSAAINIAAYAQYFAPKIDTYAEDAAQARTDVIEAAGKDAAWFDATFELSQGDGYAGQPRPSIKTKGSVDIDMSGRALGRVGGYRVWTEHTGNLDLSNNMFPAGHGIPERVHGSLNLSNNAMQSMRNFGRLHIDGDLDLSNNRHLRHLYGLKHIEIGGNLNLVGVPESDFDLHPNFSGKVFVDPANQRNAEMAVEGTKGGEVVVVGKVVAEAHPKFEGDPNAFHLDIDAVWNADAVTLRTASRALKYEERDGIATQLAAIEVSPNDIGQLRKVAFAASRVKFDLADEIGTKVTSLIPTDQAAPLPEVLANYSTEDIEWVASQAFHLDSEDRGAKLDAGDKTPSYGGVSKSARQARMVAELRTRFDAGETLRYGYGVLSSRWEDSGTFGGNTTARDLSVAVLAKQIKSTSMDKGVLMLTNTEGATKPVYEYFRDFTLQPENLAAIHRVMQRDPHNEVLQQIHDHLIDHQYASNGTVALIGKDDMAALVNNNIDQLRAPSKPLATALAQARGLDRFASAEEAKAQIAGLGAAFDGLNSEERLVLHEDVATQHLYELRHHPDFDVRAASVGLQVKMCCTLEDGRAGQMLRTMEQLTELAYQGEGREAELAPMFARLISNQSNGRATSWLYSTVSHNLEKVPAGKAAKTAMIEALVERASNDGNLERQQIAAEALASLANTAQDKLNETAPNLVAQLAAIESSDASIQQSVAKALEKLAT